MLVGSKKEQLCAESHWPASWILFPPFSLAYWFPSAKKWVSHSSVSPEKQPHFSVSHLQMLNICISFPLAETDGSTALWSVQFFHHTTHSCLFFFSYNTWHKWPTLWIHVSSLLHGGFPIFFSNELQLARVRNPHLSLHVMRSVKNTENKCRNAEKNTPGEFSHQFCLGQVREGESRVVNSIKHCEDMPWFRTAIFCFNISPLKIKKISFPVPAKQPHIFPPCQKKTMHLICCVAWVYLPPSADKSFSWWIKAFLVILLWFTLG